MKKMILSSIVLLSLIFVLSIHAFASIPTVLSGTWTFTFYESNNGSTASILTKNFNLNESQNNTLLTSGFIGMISDSNVQFLYVNIANESWFYGWTPNQTWIPSAFYGNLPILTGTIISLAGNIEDQNNMHGSWIGTFNGQTEIGTWSAVKLTTEQINQINQQALLNLGGLAIILLISLIVINL